MRVEDIMTADPACCTADQPLAEAARLMQECDCGEIPVVDNHENKRPVGVVTDRDIAIRVVARDMDLKAATVSDAMTRDVVTCEEGTSLSDCREKMEEHQVRRMPVVDAQGRVCGIVSQADIARNASTRHTAELVKDVSQPGGQS